VQDPHSGNKRAFRRRSALPVLGWPDGVGLAAQARFPGDDDGFAAVAAVAALVLAVAG